MRLLVAFDITWRGLRRLAVLGVQLAAGVAVSWLVAGPAAAAVTGVLVLLVVRTVVVLVRE